MASPAPDVSSLPPRSAAASRNLSSPGSTGLTFEARTVANGGGIAVATPGISRGYAAPVRTETRASHPVLEVKIRNLAPQPASAHFDWFFIASGLNGQSRYVWDRGQRDVSLLPGGDQTETIESTPVEQKTVTETHLQTVTTTMSNGSTTTGQQAVSSQRRVGSRPDGWIVRMFVGDVLVKVQASTTVFEQVARDPVELDRLLKMKPPL